VSAGSYFKYGYASEGIMAVRDWLAERFNVIKRLPKSLQLRFFAATVLKVIDVARCAGCQLACKRWRQQRIYACNRRCRRRRLGAPPASTPSR